MAPKPVRLAELLRRLEAAPNPGDFEEAFALAAPVMNEVENELSGIPYDPTTWASDGRMYPPQRDSERKVPGRPNARRYRSRAHSIIIEDDGSIEIVEEWGMRLCILRKP